MNPASTINPATVNKSLKYALLTFIPLMLGRPIVVFEPSLLTMIASVLIGMLPLITNFNIYHASARSLEKSSMLCKALEFTLKVGQGVTPRLSIAVQKPLVICNRATSGDASGRKIFKIFKEFPSSFLLCLKTFTEQMAFLESSKEQFSHCVAIAVARARHALPYPASTRYRTKAMV